eukprot:jgi/Orpsp1_1/1178568/evm.model.c7180000065884.1
MKDLVVVGRKFMHKHLIFEGYDTDNKPGFYKRSGESPGKEEDMMATYGDKIYFIQEIREDELDEQTVEVPTEEANATPEVLATQEESQEDPDERDVGLSNEEIVSKYYDDLREAFNEEITNELPPHREFDCKIELEPGEDVHKVGIFPCSPKEDAAVKQFIDDNMAKGYIRISESPAAYPTLVVPKKTGDSRICNDYRKLNKITKRNAYPLPRIDQVFEALKGAKVFSKLDLKSAYNLVRIREGDEYKTAFNTKYGHFEYTVMPFGLTNAPACFQSFINSVLAEEINDCCQVYLDDIVIYSKSLEEHIGHVRKVLTKLIDNKLVAKLSKCEFHKVEIAFLGHVVGKFGLKTDPEKLAAVAEWPKPQNIRQMQSFLGFCNYYRKFIKNFAKLAKSLYKMTSKGHTFVWTPEREEDFEAIKQALVSPPVLMYPNYDKPFFVEVDASNYAIGGVLSQYGDDGALHPVYYYSKSLSKAEVNYSITEKELLAIKTAFVEWRHLLQGAKHKVTIYSDHRNLLYATKPQLLTPRQVRWQQLFAGYDFQIIHRPGKSNGKADRLSRIEGPDTIGKEMNKDSILKPEQFVDEELEEVCYLIIEGEFVGELRAAIRRDKLGKEILDDYKLYPERETPIKKQWLVEEGLIFRKKNPDQIYVPQELRYDAIKLNHDSDTAGHLGIEKTFDLVQRNYYCQ